MARSTRLRLGRRERITLGGATCILAVLLASPCQAQCCSICDTWQSCCCDGPTTLFAWPCCELNYGESPTIVTDRPDFTEAASTVGRGRVQLEVGYTYIYDDEDATSVRTHSVGEPLLRVGVWKDWLELRVGWNVLDVQTTLSGASDTASGADDLYIGMKIALAEQCGWLPELAVLPQASVPVGSDGISSERFLPGLNILYGWDITERLSVGGSTQGNETIDDSGDSYLELAQSATMGYSFTDKLGGYAEWFAFFPHGAEDPGAKPEHYFNGGFTWLAYDNLQYDIRAGVGLNDAAEDYFLGAGVSYRY